MHAVSQTPATILPCSLECWPSIAAYTRTLRLAHRSINLASTESDMLEGAGTIAAEAGAENSGEVALRRSLAFFDIFHQARPPPIRLAAVRRH